MEGVIREASNKVGLEPAIEQGGCIANSELHTPLWEWANIWISAHLFHIYSKIQFKTCWF